MTAPALALERLMLDPRWSQLVAALRACTPVHRQDQADAAVADTTAVVNTMAQLLDTNRTALDPGDVDGWVRLLAIDALVGFVDGTAATCLHAPSAASPQPVLAAAWKPGLITCLRCAHLLSVGRGTEADRTCDRCGRVCAGVEQDDGIHPCLLAVSVVMFQYGVCGDCQPTPTPVGQWPTVPQPRATPRGSRGRSRGKGRR